MRHRSRGSRNAFRCALGAFAFLASIPFYGATSAVHTAKIHVFPISTGVGNQSTPAFSGRLVVWLVGRDPTVGSRSPLADVRGKDLRTGRSVQVTTHSAVWPAEVATDGRFVAWMDCRACVTIHRLPGIIGEAVYARDLRTGRIVRLGALGTVAISQGIAVWSGQGGRRHRLRARNLITDRSFLITKNRWMNASPSISGNTVVWMEMRKGNWDIVGKDLESGKRFTVARHRGTTYFEDPHVSRRLIVWLRRGARDGSVTIEARDLLGGPNFRVAAIQADRYLPSGPNVGVSGSIVVWGEASHDLSSGHPEFQVLAKDLASGHVYRIAARGQSEIAPAVSGRTVVWESITSPWLSTHVESQIDGAVLPK